ncbi:NAD(P)-binding protein [Pholiota conissans]|uniref:NAD(P)-binding protein n=1 Tax=Pholiota conissans TaxID=109636 RepID=A0A9P6CR52_9AGAR|nr:NAD(P)-binding protein [Pholiota conissans]
MSDSQVQSTIYLITGATRGLGLALVSAIASKDPTAIIYAGGRETSLTTSKVVDLATRYPGRIFPVKYIAGDELGNRALAEEIRGAHKRLDTIIANAGIENSTGKVHETTVQNYTDHFAVNVMGPIVLFQAFRDVLKASPHPRFVAISSAMGSIGLIEHIPGNNAPYGVSKAALNWAVRKIHFENEWLVTFPQCPGLVDSDMLREAKKRDTTGTFEQVLKNFVVRTPDEVAVILVDTITTSTREEDGGQFHSVDTGRHVW